MKSEIKKGIEKGLKDYRTKLIKVGDKEYKLSIFDEDEDINLFEGFLFAEAEEKSELAIFKKYRAPVSGYTPRIGLIFYKDTFLIKDYRQNRHILKTIRKVNDTFLKKLKKALAEPKADTFNKLFDRTDIIEEFYILYKKSRDFLLDNVKGISDEEKREVFVDNFMLQMLTLWYLQEREFFDGDKSYFITKFNDLKQKRLTGDVSSYYAFLRYFFDKISNSVDRQYIDNDPAVGKVVVVGPAIFLNGSQDSESISIPEKCFYKDGVTKTLIDSPPKKVSVDVPLLNLFESRDWTEGDMDEFVLGALYEKLITQDVRKKTGAYYTPEEITRYICKNTIEPYLVDRVNEKLHWNFESAAQVVDGADKKLLLFLFELLKEIKILDPAVGSAHFLESAIDVLLGVYERIWYKAKELKMQKGLVVKSSDESGNVIDVELLEISNDEQFRLYVKFFIILSKNIYGVDINPGALKVAKARLFLTLAKHFNAGKNYFIRFPNVHFNLRSGNSLIGYAKIATPKGNTTLDMFINEEDGVYVSESIKVVSKLGGYLSKTAKALGIGGDAAGEVRALNKILSKKTIDWHDFNTVLRTKEKLIKILIVSLNSEYARPLNELLQDITVLFNSKLDARFADEHGIDPDELRGIGTFHWVFEFPEVFLDRGGFDVVVGNPPYGDILSDEEKKIVEKDYLFVGNHTNSSGFNIYSIFIERSKKLLGLNGFFGMIVPNSITRVKEFGEIRSMLLKDVDLFKIVDEGNPFIGVTLEMVSIFFKKQQPITKSINVISRRKEYNNYKNNINKTIFEKSRRFVLYSDEIWEYLLNTCDRDFIDGTRGPTIKSANISKYKDKNYYIPTLLSGKSVKKYHLDKESFHWCNKKALSSELLKNLFNSKLVVSTRLLNHYRVSIKPKNVLIADNVIRLYFNDTKISSEGLCLILNSSLMAFICKNYLNNNINLTMFVNAITYDTPIKLPNKDTVFKILSNYLLQMNNHPQINNNVIQNTTCIFFDSLSNTLIYELYFTKKFFQNGLKTNFSELIAPHLEPINYDRWAELEFKDQLTDEEMKEKQALEKKNLAAIEKAYQRLRDDNEIQAHIERIKAHPWVRVVEGEDLNGCC